MKDKNCPKCGVEKPEWSTRVLCPKCYKGRNEPRKIVNIKGEPVEEIDGPVVKLASKSGSAAYVYSRIGTKTGRLVSFRRTIYLVKNIYLPKENVEDYYAQILACESIHLGMHACGLGIENMQFDKAGYHTWTNFEDAFKDYHGV